MEVICGPMFSGKTEELLRRIRRAHIAKLPVALFKPATDKRYDNVEVVSHDKNAMSSIVVDSSQALWDHIQDARRREPGRREGFSIVAVDEEPLASEQERPGVRDSLGQRAPLSAGTPRDVSGPALLRPPPPERMTVQRIRVRDKPSQPGCPGVV